MDLKKHLVEVEHAVETVITEIYREEDIVKHLQAQLDKLNAATEDGYKRVEFLVMNPDLDDDGLATAIHWNTYFGPDKDRHYKAQDLEKAVEELAAHQFSIASLSANLLQYAKQGLSAHFGKKRAGCPHGRIIAAIAMDEIIWQGRNQALHWEDGTFLEPVKKCFEHLAANADPKFGEYTERNMAYEVIQLLGWKKKDEFMSDMKLFIP
jgi:hypothetical protein